MRGSVVLFAVVTAACAGHDSSGAATTGAGACLPVVPMRLLVLEHGAEWELVSVLEADGTIVHAKQGPIDSISADQLWDANRVSSMTCTADRALRVPDQAARSARFDAEVRLIDSDGSALWVAEDGVVHWVRGGRDIMGGHARFDGAYGEARRTATIVVLATLGAGRWGGD